MACQVSLPKFPVYPSESISLVSASYISDLGFSSLLQPFVPFHVVLFGALWMPYFSSSLLGMIFLDPLGQTLSSAAEKQAVQTRERSCFPGSLVEAS